MRSPLEPTINPFSPKPTEIVETSWGVSIYDMASIHSIWRTSLVAELEKLEHINNLPVPVWHVFYRSRSHSCSPCSMLSDVAYSNSFLVCPRIVSLSWVHTAPPVINSIASKCRRNSHASFTRQWAPHPFGDLGIPDFNDHKIHDFQ